MWRIQKEILDNGSLNRRSIINGNWMMWSRNEVMIAIDEFLWIRWSLVEENEWDNSDSIKWQIRNTNDKGRGIKEYDDVFLLYCGCEYDYEMTRSTYAHFQSFNEKNFKNETTNSSRILRIFYPICLSSLCAYLSISLFQFFANFKDRNAQILHSALVVRTLLLSCLLFPSRFWSKYFRLDLFTR